MRTELADVRDFLARHEPFGDLPEELLAGVPRTLEVRYHRRDSAILEIGGVNDVLYVVRSGAVEVRADDGTLVSRLGPGESFGYTSLLTGDVLSFGVTTLEDTLVYVMPGEVFHRLRRGDAGFDQFYSQALRQRLQRATRRLHRAEDGAALMTTPLRDLITRPPVAVPPDTTIRQAAERMSDQQISSLLIIEGDRLRGLVTDRDLRTRVLARGLDPTGPVAGVMTADPHTMPAGARAFELLLRMTEDNIHHMPVVDEGHVVGLVSATDLVRLATDNPVYLVGQIRKQTSVSGLAAVSQQFGRVLQRLVEADATADDIGRAVTRVGDAVEKRLLELAEARLGPSPGPYAWMVLGSQARLEQNAASDQDNALVLGDDLRDRQAGYFEDLARFVCDGLDACGYPYCPGDVMATNPRWRQPFTVWRRYFDDWTTTLRPEALLNVTIFFDMRFLAGDRSLFDDLQTHMLSAASRQSIFQAHLARIAVTHRPPLGFFRNFVLEPDGEQRPAFDLKGKGIVPIVDLARVLALAAGLEQVNTQERLAALATAGALSQQDAADLGDALEFIGYVRLRHQARQLGRGKQPDNLVAPDSLSSFERRHLKDAFKIVSGMQTALEDRFQLRFLG